MLIIAEERATYPPDGRMPNLETDEQACDEILTRITPLLPTDLRGETVGRLLTWSASTLLLDSNFATWAEAITAAKRYAQGEIAGATDSQRHRDEAIGGDDLAKLATAVLSTGRTDDPQIQLRDKSRQWANCGMAAFQIREQLRSKAGDPVRVSTQTYGAGKGAALKQALLVRPASAEIVLLLECQFPQVHNFMIEVEPEPAFERRRRALLIAVGGDQGRVQVDDHPPGQ
ncbi:hypothetical protein [Micromonospora sp. NBC_01638]|uniref:hypothetical protein n=1 Tax=Micromonospora sp. NBC_01638 TaxID=2975982 RepID=UPI00386FD4CA